MKATFDVSAEEAIIVLNDFIKDGCTLQRLPTDEPDVWKLVATRPAGDSMTLPRVRVASLEGNSIQIEVLPE